LFIGWLAGIVCGTSLAFIQDLKPLYGLHIGDATYSMYIGLIALALNLVLTFVLSAVLPAPATQAKTA
jgi:SSS family solute:Na+ symporter